MATLMNALRAYIEADATLAAKVTGRVYDSRLPQNPGDNNVVIKFISGTSWSTLAGATGVHSCRIEFTFWCKLAADAATLANRLRVLLASFNSSMSGVKIGVFKTYGPRNMQDDATLYYGTQMDILAVIDMDTVS